MSDVDPVELAATHALAWLAVGCAVGLLLATLLVAPAGHALLGRLTYGRWMPLHLDLLLYGWCALPLVALLLRWCEPGGSWPLGASAVHGWSASLVAGAASWLAGATTAKPFLDWSGAARGVFLGAQVLLAVALLDGLLRRWRRGDPRHALLLRAITVLALLSVPLALATATRTDTYPPVNPSTGGPTGTSLLGSTLAIVAIVAVSPLLLGLHEPRHRRATATLWVALTLHGAVFSLLDHGDRTHRDWLQVLAVVGLVPWVPALATYLRDFRWPRAAGPWLLALCGWAVALVLSSAATFLPGVLDQVKFTDVLVAHAHAAMAGMCSSLAALLLVALGAERRAMHRRLGFVLWQVGCALHVAALVLAGALEAVLPDVSFGADGRITALYGVRWIGGGLMLVAAWLWLRRATAT